MSNGLVAPVLSQVSYTGSLIVANFTYEDDPDWSSFQIALFEGSNPTPTQTAPCGALSGQLLNPQVNTTSVWWVKIAATNSGTPGPYSNSIAVVVGPPQNVTVAADEAAIVVSWTPPVGATIAYGANLSLSAGQVAFSAKLTGSPGVYRPPGGFNPNLSYVVQLGGMTTTNSYGPYSAQVAVVQATPVLSEVTYVITGAAASTIIANSSTIDPTYVLGLYLYQDGRLYDSTIAGAPGAIVELPLTELLDPAFTWTVAIAFTNTAATTRGPLTDRVPLIVEPVSIETVAYDGTAVTASWKNGVGSPHPTGGYVEIDDGTTTVASASTLGTSISITHHLTTGTKYKLQSTGQRGNALGPAGTKVNVLTYLPSPSSVTFDGQNIGVTWSAIGDTDVTGMNVALLNAGTVVQSQPGGNLATSIPAALAPTGTYDIALQTTGDRTVGPFGTSVPVISAVPRVTGATYSTSGTTSSIEVKWNAAEISNAHGITGYSVQLYQDGAALGAAVPVSGSSADRVTVSINSLLDVAKAHTITVQATGAKSSGPLSAPSPVITAAPQFTSIVGNGTSFTAAWTTIGQDGVTGYKISIGGTHYTTSLNSITFTYSGDANPAVSVLARGAAAEGPATSTTLLTASIDVKSTSYDGSMLTATWLASTAPPAYVLEVLEGSNVIASLTSTATQATLPVALSASATYSAGVRPASADGVVIGPRSTTAPVVAATPTISAIGFDGTNVTGTVTAPGGVSLDSTTLKVQLYANGIAVGTAVSASGGAFTIPATGTAGSALTVRAQLTGTKSSVDIAAPFSIDYPVLTATPVIDAALFSFSSGTTWNISASWTLPDADPSAGTFTVVLTQNSVALKTWTITGNSLSDSVDNVDTTKNLTLTVTAKGNYGTGPASAAATFVPATIGSVTSVVDANRVTAMWTDAAGTSFTAHRLRLVQQAGTAWVTIAEGESISGTTAFVEVPSALIGTDAVYGITIDAAIGLAWSASNSVKDIIVQAPFITSAHALAADSMYIAWDAPPAPPGVDGYQPVMIWDGGQFALDVFDGPEATITIPSLVPNNSWVTISAIKGHATGPSSISMAFVVDMPSGVSVAYDGTNISASWNAAEDNRISAYRVTFTASGSEPVIEVVSTPSWSKAFTPTPGQTATVSLCLVAGVSRGMTTAALDAILNAPAITKSLFDGSQLTLNWSGVADSAAAAYLIEVLEGTSVVASLTSSGVQATLPVALSASASYSVTVRAASADGAVTGPLSTAAPVVAATPTISSIGYDGTSVTGTVTAPGGVSLDSSTLNVQLYANGIAVGTAVSASGGAFTIPATGTAGSALTVRAQLTGTKSSVDVAAPFSIDYPVLTATPAIDAALFSFSSGTTWNISASWTLPDADPSAGTFTVVLTQNSVALKTWTITGNSLNDSVDNIDTTKNLTLTVTAKGNYGTGPASAAATFVPTTIASVSSVVDGNRVTATWTDAAGTSFTAHRLRLVQQAGTAWVTIAEGQSISGTTAFVEVPSALIEADAVYGVTIDAAVGLAWSASNSVNDIVVQTPYITSARTLAKDSMHVAWDAPPAPAGITSYQPVMIWEGGELALDAVDATEATISIPSLVPNNSWITIGAIKGSANGPLSTSMAFVVDMPAGVSVAYDGTNISATWNAAEDSRVSAYRVTFTASGSAPVIETVSTPSWSKAFTPTAGQTATVSVGLVAGVSRGMETTALDAILNAPAITKAAFDGSQLNLTWSGVTDTAATAYVINVMSGGSVIAEYTSGGTTATIPFAASADTIQIRAIGSSTSGPLSAAFTPISITPNVTSIAFSAADGSLTIGWGAIPGAGRYNVVFRSANSIIQQANPTTNSLTITAANLPASGIYDVTVQAFAAVANDDVSGPISAPLPAVIVPPPDVKVAYDGRNARVTWEPLASPSITGYDVSILNGATIVTSQITTNPAAVIALAYASTNDYDVVVQALTSAGSGQPSTKGKLFQAGWYPSTETDKAAYIKPATNAAMTKYDIVVYLPNIFTTYVSSGLPDIPPFKIETASAPFSYKLTIAATSDAWNFNADSIRSGIATAYTNLLTALVAKNVTPLGWRAVQDAISRAMPQTFAETLYYGYAFVPGDGYVDLKPGMLLRADFESYQYLGPDQTVSEYVDGFVSTSSAIYDVGSYVTSGDVWLNGFDAFLSLVTQSGSTVPAPQTSGTTSSGGGGIIDLYYAQFRKPYVRLVYPPTILGDRTAEARVAFNVAVLAANDYPTLNTATGYLRDAQPLPSGVAATYLRGRTMISACIRVWLDGQPLIVPVGSSVGNVLEQMGRRPPITIPQQGAPGIALSGIALERSIGYAATDPSGYSISKTNPIRLDWNLGMAYSAATDWLNIPLLPGDRIVTRGNE